VEYETFLVFKGFGKEQIAEITGIAVEEIERLLA